MSHEQDAAPTLDGFIPQAESPKETPQPQGSPDKQKQELETPEQTDSTTAEAVETTPTKTPEQLEADRAFFQQKFQEERERSKAAIAQLRELQGSTNQQVNLAEFARPQQTPSPQAQPAQPTLPGNVDYNNMPIDELKALVASDPLLQMQLQQYQIAQMLDAKLTEREQAREADRQLQIEQDKSYAVLNSYVSANGVTQQEVQEAAAHLKSLGVNARPAAVTELLIKQIEFNKWQNLAAQQTQAAVAKATQAAKKQALTIAPTGGGGSTTKPTTPADVIASKFKQSNEMKVIDSLFSGTK